MLLKLSLKIFRIKLNMYRFYNRQPVLFILKFIMVKGLEEIELQFPNQVAYKCEKRFYRFLGFSGKAAAVQIL